MSRIVSDVGLVPDLSILQRCYSRRPDGTIFSRGPDGAERVSDTSEGLRQRLACNAPQPQATSAKRTKRKSR